MKRIACLLVALATMSGAVAYVAPPSRQAGEEAAPIFGIKIPPGYRDWKLISVAHEAGNLNDIRAILGNDIAIKAYREASCRSPMAQLSPDSPGPTCRQRKTTKCSAASNRSLPGLRRCGTCSLWSRTRKNTPQRRAGGMRNLIKTANLPTRPSTRPASRATCRSKLATTYSPVTRLNAHFLFEL